MFRKSQKGFTFLELIAVLIILGILAAVAVTRATNFDVEVVTGADTLKSHLRYAQTMAMNSNPNAPADQTVWGISCDGTSYWLFNGTDSGDNIMRLPEDDSYIDANRRINLAAKKISVSGFTVFFDNRGIPYSAYPGTPLASDLTISVSPIGGGTNVNINIKPLTGYMP
ncbi:MAG TPA: type II secretion system protein [Deltaproteobacteria bacterium]|nr:type II secretion system protein [Deltaproteobacteria bacterium]